MTQAQIDELKKPAYKAFYDADDWQGAADAVKAANVRLPAADQPVSVVSRWFSDEIDLCINVSMGVPDADLDQITASIFLARWDRRVAGPGGMVPVGSPGFRAVLEEMVAAKVIRENERFGSTDAQIESVCTERWEPSADEISKAILSEPELASIRDSIWRPNGTRKDQPDHIEAQEVIRRAQALAELAAQNGGN